MKLLIGYDGSDSAKAALDDLSLAGLPVKGVEALVFSVAGSLIPPPPPSSFEIVEAGRKAQSVAALQHEFARGSESVKVEQKIARQAVATLKKHFPQWHISAEASYGSPASELIWKADQWEPDPIVVGSHGHGLVGRLLIGSVAQKVVTEARTSVRVARGPVLTNLGAARILIGIDGSPAAEQAVRAVAEREWPPCSEVRLLLADEPLEPTLIGNFIPPVRRWIAEANKDEKKHEHKLLDRAAVPLVDLGLTVSTVIKPGDPKRLLVDEAEEWAADAIFVGATGSGNRLSRFLLGSVSAAVAARAHCSVEIVRKPA